jgi:hypothetical protein
MWLKRVDHVNTVLMYMQDLLMDGHSGDVWQLAMHPTKPNIMVGMQGRNTALQRSPPSQNAQQHHCSPTAVAQAVWGIRSVTILIS